jgi:hypothetical protein
MALFKRRFWSGERPVPADRGSDCAPQISPFNFAASFNRRAGQIGPKGESPLGNKRSLNTTQGDGPLGAARRQLASVTRLNVSVVKHGPDEVSLCIGISVPIISML